MGDHNHGIQTQNTSFTLISVTDDMGDTSPVWSYDDRGYYSMAFIGYIFLYTVIVWSYGLPTPRVNSFEFIQQQSEESSYESEPEIENETIFVNNLIDNQ